MTDDDGQDHGRSGGVRERRPARRPRAGSGTSKRRLAHATEAARAAAGQVLTLTGHDVEGVVSVERMDGGWRVGVELVETHRIPDTADILAVYEVETGDDGELRGMRRVERYARGQLKQGGQ